MRRNPLSQFHTHFGNGDLVQTSENIAQCVLGRLTLHASVSRQVHVLGRFRPDPDVEKDGLGGVASGLFAQDFAMEAGPGVHEPLVGVIEQSRGRCS